MALGDRTITYSPAYTLVPTYECFNRCDYCNFRQEPGQDRWLSLGEAGDRLAAFQPVGATAAAESPGLAHPASLPAGLPAGLSEHSLIEVLILSGEVHPASPRRAAWFQRIYDLAALALAAGFLPHSNVGPLTRTEMAQLKQVNVSLGLMLEQLTPALLETVHRHAPSKQPERRLEQLRWAGELGIPFTTGLLLGIGETAQDRRDSLAAIAQLHHQYGHIQEVILQPHSPGQRQRFGAGACDPVSFLQTVEQARGILPPAIAIQIPPNLAQSPDLLRACLAAGARDLGGLVPHDEVNPDYRHLTVGALAAQLAGWGYELCPRLPVYPAQVAKLNPGLRERCRSVEAGLSSNLRWPKL